MNMRLRAGRSTMATQSGKHASEVGMPKKELLGEALIKSGLISKEQLQKALKRRAQVDLPLGSILIEMGFLSTEDLLDVLSKKFGVPAVNLFKLDIDQSVLDQIPADKMKQYKILPISMEGGILTLAMISPQDFIVISDLEFTIGKKIRPVIVPFFMMESALNLISSDYQNGLKGDDIAIHALSEKTQAHTAPQIEKLLLYFIKTGASDMLLTAGAPPAIKIRSEVQRISSSLLTPVECEDYAKQLLDQDQWEKFLHNNELDIAMTYPNIGRFRMNFYRQRNSVSISIRHVTDKIPTLNELKLPAWLRDYALKPQGLILISGPAGHGKSTTMNAMLDIINANRKANIITLEDPVEYLHKHKKSNINQREVGRDTESFAKGLRGIFRQAPDVIVIGELRDVESFEIALRAARTGHLVLSTMNAADSTAIIRIIINMFPANQQNMVLMLLAEALVLSLAQRLIPRRDGKGVIIATEKFANSYRVSNFIREGKLHQIRSQMEGGTEEFSSLDASLAELYKKGIIEFDDAFKHAINPLFFRELTKVKA
ncbi:MAG: PilT/PilU family type 4a pilus ATPase [Desulfobacteraceae bacterium]|nr:MAG: PilT/PilU family type 4a pilus ATPase [Desulfobacteraceae bacterium]